MADKTIYETSDGKVFTGGYGGDVNSFRAESEARAHQDQLDREANKTPAQRAREEKEYKDSQAAITVREVEVRQELERKLITAKQGDIDAIMWVIGCYSQGMHYRVYDYEKALEWSFILLDKKHPGAHVYIRNGLAGLTRSIEIEDSSSRAKLKQAYQKYKSMAARKGVD
ncbi:MAG: hypothetical protein LBH42_08660, partial [Treponema sp.]|nr:hypothetical protein [Treponema sp.]